jgi:hypothetical protein
VQTGDVIADSWYCATNISSCPGGFSIVQENLGSYVRKEICNQSAIECSCPTGSCEKNMCRNGGTCVALTETFTAPYYTCSCPCGFTGTKCEKPDRVYPYGIGYNDILVEFVDEDDGYKQIGLNKEFLFGSVQYSSLYVHVNGFVSFDRPLLGAAPEKFPTSSNISMIAPFWADIDLSYGNGSVYYHEYNRDVADVTVDPLYAVDQYVFNLADSHIQSGIGDTGFFATSVVVITWQNVSPYPSLQTSLTEKACFQLVLMSDSSRGRSYTMFNYNFIGWNRDANRMTSQGLQSDSGPKGFLSFSLFTSNTQNAYSLDTIPGNLGTGGVLGVGQWLWRTSLDVAESAVDSPTFICQTWLLNQNADPDMHLLLIFISQLMPNCPCTFSSAVVDPRFVVDYVHGCAVSAFPLDGHTFAQKCCYRQVSIGVFDELLTSDMADSGSLLSGQPDFFLNTYITNDEQIRRPVVSTPTTAHCIVRRDQLISVLVMSILPLLPVSVIHTSLRWIS